MLGSIRDWFSRRAANPAAGWKNADGSQYYDEAQDFDESGELDEGDFLGDPTKKRWQKLGQALGRAYNKMGQQPQAVGLPSAPYTSARAGEAMTARPFDPQYQLPLLQYLMQWRGRQ